MAVAPSPWISGPRFDLGLLMGPALLACAVAWALPAGWTLPAWGWLLAIVGIDVAHVYASIYRTVLDPVAWRARKTVFVGIGSTVAIGLLCLWWMLGEVGFWRVLAYLAVFHFVRQVWGFAALYRLREGLGTRGLDATVERWALYALTGWPLLWWHVHGPLAFAWFIPEDFFVGLPAWTLWPAGVLGGAVILAHLVFRLRSRRAAWGRDLWMLTTGVVWIGGIVLFGGDGAFSLTNVVAHGVPYVALVLLVGHRSWRLDGRGPLFARWFAGPGAALLVVPLLVLAVAEEALWDWLVWQEHGMIFGAPFAEGLPELAGVLAVPLLAWPQVVHYVLDGMIWRLDGSNPGLRRLLEGSRAEA